MFNTSFANQCTLLNNSSVLSNNLAKLTNESIDSINFSTDNISKIINNLNPNKTHGHEMLSILIIKLCENSICKPLSIIFNDSLKEKKFPRDWKKAHVVPVQKKGHKQCLEIIDLLAYLKFPAKSLSVWLTISCSLLLLTIDLFLLTNKGLDLVNLVLNNYLLLLMKYVSRLRTDLK